MYIYTYIHDIHVHILFTNETYVYIICIQYTYTYIVAGRVQLWARVTIVCRKAKCFCSFCCCAICSCKGCDGLQVCFLGHQIITIRTLNTQNPCWSSSVRIFSPALCSTCAGQALAICILCPPISTYLLFANSWIYSYIITCFSDFSWRFLIFRQFAELRQCQCTSVQLMDTK